MKSLQDSARANVYDHHELEGWGTRILIGGILAAIVMIIFDPDTFTSESVPLTPAAIAFLTGLGVRVVYGALERIIETLADKLGLDNIRARPEPKVE